MGGILILGLIAAPSIPRETFPDVPAEKVEIRAVYPGASAEEAEGAICRRIEDAVDGVENLEETRCEAMEGMAVATLEMEEGGRMERFLEDIKSEIEAIDSFPKDVEQPTMRQLERTDFVAAVAITGPNEPGDLKSFAEQLKDRLMQLSGVSKVTVSGFSDRQIRIEVPSAALRQYGLSVDALARMVASQSLDMPGGLVKAAGGTVLIHFNDERRLPREFEDLVVVAGESGAEVRLGDIATITSRFELDEAKSLFNGKRAAYLIVEKGRSDDTLSVIDSLRDTLEDEQATAPPAVTIAITQDVSSIVRDRLGMLLRNSAQGLVLVFLVMWAFFSLRYSFWIVAGLPVSFLGAIAAMAAMGYSFDMVTMVGLLIGVGLLMDDAIVISESIASRRQLGDPPLEAAVEGTRQVLPGVVSSLLTTVCVFGSLAFMTGKIGMVFKVLPVILIMVLLFSLIEAFLILPHHLSSSMAKHDAPPGPVRRRIEHGIAWTREELVGRLVDKAVQWRYLTLGVVASLLLISAAMAVGGVLKFRAFPDQEGDVIQARILLPQGTPLKRTEDVVARLLAALDDLEEEFRPRQPDRQDLIRNVGVQYGKNVDAFETGSHVATISVDLLGSDIRGVSMDDVLNRWREKASQIPDVLNVKFAKQLLGLAGRPVDIRLKGQDLDRLKAASLELQKWLNGYRGMLDLNDDLRPGKPEIRIRLRDGATALGLSAANIASQIRSAFYGHTADEIQVGSEAYEIDVRLLESDRNSLADLESFTVSTQNGSQVPLSAVATFSHNRGYARINRVDGLRTVTVRGDLDTDLTNANEIIKDTSKRFFPELKKRYPEIRIDLQGQAKEAGDTAGSVRRNLVVGLLGVFLILSFQFRSYIAPVVVMAAIPLSLIGVVFGHMLLGYDLSMPSIIGAASLTGVVVNDSILLVRLIRLYRLDGKTVHEAALKAARQRFRAIVLTSLTTMAGLLPILTETSLQAQVLAPLVTSLAFGLFTATFMVLFFVPAFYTILDDFNLTAKRD